MNTSRQFDLVVIGSGPGGYVAALRAAQLGMRTAIVERESLGGVCLNWGCIPTKALLHGADTMRRIRKAAAQGITVSEPQADLGKMMARSREVAGKLNRGVSHLLSKAGVTVIMGKATVPSAGQVQVEDTHGAVEQLSASHIIVAAGARASELPLLPFDGERVWSYRDALSATTLPKSLAVVGAGAIGVEFASFYSTLGTEVTIIEAAPRVLPSADDDVSGFVQQSMSAEGVRILTDASLQKGEVQTDGVRLSVEHGGRTETLHVERVLVAVGLTGNAEGLGLERLGVEVEKGLIRVGDWGATAHSGLYAIGDITGAPMLAHKASHQGVACVEYLAGLRSGAQPNPPMPACVYGYPQSAAMGLTEREARRKVKEVKVGKFPLEANGKAVAIDETAGFIKTIFDSRTGELLGAHLVGSDATELVHGYVLSATLEATEAEVMETVFPHPTVSEAMHEAVLAAYGRAVHIPATMRHS